MPDLGQNWLLLRGLARESAHWGEFPQRLQQCFPTAKLHTLDLPGTGQFYQQPSPKTISAITASVRQQAFNLGLLERPVTLLAVSLGGMVAWEWMRQHPQEIAGASLINTSFATLNPFYQRLRWQSLGKLASILTEHDRYRRELGVVSLVSNRPEHYQQTADDWRKIQSLRPISAWNSLRQIVAAAQFKPGLHRPEPPILLLNGRGDRLVAPECSHAIHRQWQLELESHPWAGHDLTLDAPDWVAEKLTAWVESQPV